MCEVHTQLVNIIQFTRANSSDALETLIMNTLQWQPQGQRQLTDPASSMATAVSTTTATAMSRVHAFIR